MSKVPKDKFKQVVHYLLWFCSKNRLDINNVKLGKLIWLLDVWAICSQHESLTGEAFYIKRPTGPVPTKILAALEALDTEGKLQIKGYTEEDKIAVASAQVTEPVEKDIAALSQDEREQIASFCKKYSSTKALIKMSHDEVYHNYAAGDKIPLAAYLVAKTRMPTKGDIERAKEIFKL